MIKIDCKNMNEECVCKLDMCTCGYIKGKCENITCENYSSIEDWIADIIQTDSEIWSADIEGNSREDIISDGMKYAKEEGYASFRIGKRIPVGVPTLDIDGILENAYDQVYDEVGECAEGFLDDVTKEQQKELEEQLNEVFFKWVVKHKLEPTCYTIINDEVIDVLQEYNTNERNNEIEIKMIKIITIENVMSPNFVGGNSYDECLKNNWFHVSIPKGTILETENEDWQSKYPEIHAMYKERNRLIEKAKCKVYEKQNS